MDHNASQLCAKAYGNFGLRGAEGLICIARTSFSQHGKAVVQFRGIVALGFMVHVLQQTNAFLYVSCYAQDQYSSVIHSGILLCICYNGTTIKYLSEFFNS